MINLKFKVKKQILERRDKNVLVAKSRNFISCTFVFDQEWEGLEKFVIFTNDKEESFTCFLGAEQTGSCIVPGDAMAGDFMTISLYAGDLLTSSEVMVVLLPSGYTTEITSIENAPTDMFIDLLDRVERKIDCVKFNDGVLLFYSEGTLTNSVPIMKFSQEIIQKEIHDQLPSFELENDGDLFAIYPEIKGELDNGK